MGGEGRLAFCLELQNFKWEMLSRQCVSTNLLACCRLPYWQDTLKDVVLEAVIFFDCRNEKKEEDGFLLNR